MIVDFHVHCFPDGIAKRAVTTLAENADIEPRLDGTISSIKQSMSKANIDYSILLSIATKPSQTENVNSWSGEINGGNIIAFGSIHPEYRNWKAELSRIKELGLKGIKLHPDYQLFYVDEARMFPVYEYAFALGLMIVFHAGIDVGLPAPYHCTPERLLQVVKAFPGGKIVAAHMGSYACWDDVERYLVGQDLFFDTSYSLGWLSDAQAKRIIVNHGYKKILFATDSPWTDQGEEIQKLKRLQLGIQAEDAILGDNARNLLNL